jgi:hypothetical protein
MPIARAEHIFRPAKNTTQTTAHGGKMDWDSIITGGVLAGLIADFTESERTAGSTRRYKIFDHVADSENITSGSHLIYLAAQLGGNGFVANLKTASLTDTWADVSASRRYGTGKLNTTASAGASTLVIDTDGASYNQFQNGDQIIIHNKAGAGETGLDDTTGTIEKHTISGAPSWNGDEVTVTLAGTLANTYNPTRTVSGNTVYSYVCSHPAATNVSTGLTKQNNTSAAGTLAEAQITVPNIGAVSQTITITFTGATTFTAVSDDAGITLASGSTGSTYAPTNPDSGTALISIPAAAWGGTWQSGDSIQLVTTPAAKPVWLEIVCTAGASAANEAPELRVYGYSGSA